MQVKFNGSCLKQDRLTYTDTRVVYIHKRTVSIYAVYQINLWAHTLGADSRLGNSLFRAVELIKNANFDKYRYSGYGIGFLVQAEALYYLMAVDLLEM